MAHFADKKRQDFSGKPEYLKEIGGIYSHMIQLQNVSENWKMA